MTCRKEKAPGNCRARDTGRVGAPMAGVHAFRACWNVMNERARLAFPDVYVTRCCKWGGIDQ